MWSGHEQAKLLLKILTPKNVQFSDMVLIVGAFGFRLLRINGSHHIFSHPDIPDIVNLQMKNGKAKPYQVRQFFQLVEQYRLELGE